MTPMQKVVSEIERMRIELAAANLNPGKALAKFIEANRR